MALNKAIQKLYLFYALCFVLILYLSEVESCCCSYWLDHKFCGCNPVGCNCKQSDGMCHYRTSNYKSMNPYIPDEGSCKPSTEVCEDWMFGRKKRSINGRKTKLINFTVLFLMAVALYRISKHHPVRAVRFLL